MPALFVYSAIGAELRISNVDEFIQFKNKVNSGSTFSGYTVFLDSDLSLSGKTMTPIGNSSKYFRGIFDGQGHVISNLKFSSSSFKHVGLFGFSNIITIKNIILDSSCSFTSSSRGNYQSVDSTRTNIFSYTGGILGYCYPNKGSCNIESSVNMASVSFCGTMETSGIYYSYTYLGGIAGSLDSPSYTTTVKNCANYGSVTFSGKSGDSNIGGITGISHGYSSSLKVSIYNCLNHGTITHSGTTTVSSHIGGISGYNQYSTFDNCLSSGKITASGSASERYTGSVLGQVASGVSVTQCFWTSDVGYNSVSGGGSPSVSSSNQIQISATTVGNLNSRASSKGWNKWLLNTNSAAVTFKINNNKGFSVSKKAILFPDLSPTGSNKFAG